MNTDKILELISYMLPAIIVAGVAYYFMESFVKNEDNRRRFLMIKDNQQSALPLKLQAYERVTILMERIDPTKLLTRIAPISKDKNDYGTMLINQIDQEFEHNTSQQIYISNDCWSIISTAKNATIQSIRRFMVDDAVVDAAGLREKMLENFLEKATPSSAALAFIKNEVRDII